MTVTVRSRDEIRLEDHVGLIWMVAHEFGRKWQIDPCELLMPGFLGLRRAAEKWDPEISGWSTYAGLWIKAKIGRWLREENSGGSTTYETMVKVTRARGIFYAEHGRVPTDEEVSEYTNGKLTVEKIRRGRARESIRNATCGSYTMKANGFNFLTVTEKWSNKENGSTHIDYQDLVHTCERRLVKMDRKIFGLYFIKDMSLREVAEKMNLKMESVRRRICSIIRILQETLGSPYGEAAA